MTHKDITQYQTIEDFDPYAEDGKFLVDEKHEKLIVPTILEFDNKIETMINKIEAIPADDRRGKMKTLVSEVNNMSDEELVSFKQYVLNDFKCKTFDENEVTHFLSNETRDVINTVVNKMEKFKNTFELINESCDVSATVGEITAPLIESFEISQ